jgi:endoglucanase
MTLAVLIGVAVAGAFGDSIRAHQAYAQQCRDRYPSHRDRSNPLMLRHPPGADPLAGAHFFVDGPRHGDAAGAIASMLGVDPASYRDTYSWARFKSSFDHGRLHDRPAHDPILRFKVNLLEKIAAQPEEQRFSLYSAGGGPGAIFDQVQKIFCRNLSADPGSIPIITTFFLYQAGYCESRDQILANQPNFQRQIDEMTAGIGNRPAVMLLELDGVATSRCSGPGGLSAWEDDLRYEIDKTAALAHAVVYVEAGYSDANGPGYTAGVLNAIGIDKIRGFFTNDTHNAWTTSEITWGEQVSALTHGAHFIVNTATNGNGPLIPGNRVLYGNEVLCNPPGRGMGHPETTDTGFKRVDAFLWTGVPGNSSGRCNGGPDSGVFWLARALDLAAHANARLGPGYPSNPY